MAPKTNNGAARLTQEIKIPIVNLPTYSTNQWMKSMKIFLCNFLSKVAS
jgi:hypothetical protein